MLTLFNQERVTELYGMEMREEGREEGIGIGKRKRKRKRKRKPNLSTTNATSVT